eukprot:scaffold56832_cov30-Phaeocystis_antarctica.AAC.2
MLAPGGAVHSEETAVALSAQWEAAARAPASDTVADYEALTIQALEQPDSLLRAAEMVHYLCRKTWLPTAGQHGPSG